MEALLQDIRYAVRRLAKSPGFALVAILTLALEIGANTAIFSVVNAVLLRSLPFAEPDRLVMLYTAYPQDETRYPLSPPDFMSYHDDARSFADVVAVNDSRQTLTDEGEPRRVDVGVVSADFFELMGAQPILGRTFRAEENEPGRNTVAVLTHAYWQQQFGADPGVMGNAVTLNGVQREVVGVLPPEFDFPGDRQIYYPLEYTSSFSSTTAEGRRGEFLTVIGRLKPGVTMEQADTEVRTISQRLQQEFPETNSENISLSMVRLQDEMLGEVRTPLLILLGAVSLVLLIACVNVANLLLARATARSGELAVRVALGARRGRLIRQLLTESMLLGLAGGAAGLLLAVWGTQALIAARPEGIPRLDEIGIDGSVVTFTAGVALATGILFGLLPAVQVTRSGLSGSLREGGRGSLAARGADRTRRGLVIAEMALAVMLLIGAGLLIRSFLQLSAVDPGFRTERVVTFDLSLPSSVYEDGAAIRGFYDQLLNRVEALPGVEAVAAASELPLTGFGSIYGFEIENREPPPPGFVQDAAVTRVTPGYLRTLAIPLRNGRVVDERDRADGPEALLVNEAFVRRYFPNEDPLGRRLTFDGENWVEIVGVTGDVPQQGLDQEVRPGIYAPFPQFTTRSMTVVVRTSTDPLALTRTIRAEVDALDPNLPVERFRTAGQIVSESVAQPRFYTMLLAVFAGVALVLAAIGIYGVISYAVAQQTREIGVRVALGAEARDVVGLVLKRALLLSVVGVGVGIGGALLLTRLLDTLLYNTATTDPLTYLAVAVTLLGVALLASYLPARRAARVDPMIALRGE